MNNMPNRYVTAVGVAEYPHIEEPDTKFDENGLYHVNLILNKDACETLIESLEADLNSFENNDPKIQEAKAKRRPINVADIYEDLEDGTIRLKFKQKATYQRKSDGKTMNIKIPVFDAKGKPITDTKIGGGSKLRICFTANPYYMPATKTCGLSLRLVAVKLIELKEYGANNAEAYGFGEEEDGYSADDDVRREDEPESKSVDELEDDYNSGDF